MSDQNHTTPNATFSLESEGGATPCASPAGQMTTQSGQVVAPASRSAKRGKGKWTRMNVTYGPLFETSSPSADLQFALENKLQERMAAFGSPEYALTWKHWDMPSGPPICALRASARHIKGKDFIGWQTATVQDAHGRDRHNQKNGSVILSLLGQAQMLLLGWATPRQRDYKGNGVSISRAAKGVADCLDVQCKLTCLSGTDPQSPLSARMDRGAYPLNPMHSLWLMGFPQEWSSCAEAAMLSFRNSQRSSSKRS